MFFFLIKQRHMSQLFEELDKLGKNETNIENTTATTKQDES